MPDSIAHPIVNGRTNPATRAEAFGSCGLVMLAVVNVGNAPLTLTAFTPDEARRLGIALMCVADEADSGPEPPPSPHGERRMVAAGRITRAGIEWFGRDEAATT